MTEKATHTLKLPLGQMAGVGVVRDKDGNIKGTEPTQEKRSGDDSDERSRERGG